jgi:hypothetical protein
VSVDAEEKAAIWAAFYVNLVFAKVLGFEGREEIVVM